MIEVRVFATLRQGMDKVTLLSPEGIACAGDILDRMNIPQEEVSILLINGFHHKPESEVKDGDIVALFPPVGLLYFGIMLLVSLAVNRQLDQTAANFVTTMVLCLLGGMLGGMCA